MTEAPFRVITILIQANESSISAGVPPSSWDLSTRAPPESMWKLSSWKKHERKSALVAPFVMPPPHRRLRRLAGLFPCRLKLGIHFFPLSLQAIPFVLCVLFRQV